MFFRLKRLFVRIAQIDRKDSSFGNDIDGIWLKGDRTDRRDRPAAGLQTALPQEDVDLRRGQPRIDPHGSRRCSRVVLPSLDGHFKPGDSLQILNRTDLNPFLIKNRPLFDMQFDKGAGLGKSRLITSGVPDPFELITQHAPVNTANLKRIFSLHAARVDERAQHIGRVAHALLIGEGRNHDRADRFHAIFLECPDDLDAGKHAAEASMDFTEYRVNFSSAKDLCDLLSRVDAGGFDVLALVRGGGSGIERLDDLPVLERVVSLETPLICAVGHVDEKLFLKLVSDKVAPTPNGLGQWFSDIAEKVAKTRQDSIAVITRQVQKQFQERLDTQVKQNKELQEKLTALTKQGEASQKQSAEAGKKLQEQLTEANKKNGELAKTIESQTKAHADQMKALNDTLTGFKKESSEQAAKQNQALTSLQKNYSDLQQQNTRLNSDLTKAREELAKASSGSGKINGLTVFLIIAVVVLLILLLAK